MRNREQYNFDSLMWYNNSITANLGHDKSADFTESYDVDFDMNKPPNLSVTVTALASKGRWHANSHRNTRDCLTPGVDT